MSDSMNDLPSIGLWPAFTAWFAPINLVLARDGLSLPGPITVDLVPTGSGFLRFPRSAPGQVVTLIRLTAGEAVRFRLMADKAVTVWALNGRGPRRITLYHAARVDVAPAAPPIPEVTLSATAVSPIAVPEPVGVPSLRQASPKVVIPMPHVEIRVAGVRAEFFVPDSTDDGLFIHSSAPRSEA